MTDFSSQRSPYERELNDLIVEYYHAAEQGRPLDQAQFLWQHPDFAAELREFFENVERVDRVAPPLSPAAEETQGGDSSLTSFLRRTSFLRPGVTVQYFGDYEILEEIGAGGMGVVYKARQAKLRKIVAIKMIKAGQLASEEEVRRFQTEARAAANLNHPGIVPVHEVGVYQGQHYYTMDYVGGISLSQLHRDEPVAAYRGAELVKQLAEAMHYAHDQGIVHRDLKPANVLLTTTGVARITDFGLAKRLWSEDESAGMTMTETGQVLGTAGYMSPEQAAGKTRLVGPPADIYALGAILYALLTGRAPFVGESQAATILQVLQNEPVTPRTLNPSIARDLETICLKCLEKEPHKRYGTAQLLADDLARFLENRPVLARPVSGPERSWRWCRRNPWIAGLGATVAASLLIGTIISSTLAVIAYKNHAESDRRGNALAQTRDQARVRVAELREEIAQNLAQRKVESAEAHLNELITLAARFSGLVDTNTVDELRQSIRQHAGIWKAEESFAAAEEALARQELHVFVDQLRAYLKEPYATKIALANSLLADAELILARASGDDALVAGWSDEELAEYLRSLELPPPIVIANAALRDIYQTRLQDLAIAESERRAAAKRERELADSLLRPDKERAARFLRGEEPKLPAAEKEEWLAHPERHGVLALIPQDAIGGISIAGMNRMHKVINDAERDYGKSGAAIAPFVRWVLATRPFNCYQRDQPLALVFANPVKAGELKGEGALKEDPFNPVVAMGALEMLEGLGVVVGTPTALADVERKLELPAGSLAGEEMQHPTVGYYGKPTTVSVLLRDKLLYVGFNDRAVNSVADALGAKDSLARDLDAQEGARLASMDALLHFGPGSWQEVWGAMAADLRDKMAADKDDKEAVELADNFEALMRRAGKFLLGVKLDKGVDVSLRVLLSPGDDARRDRFASLLGEGDAPLTFSGLPDDGATVAFATRGKGVSNALIAQSLFLLPLGPGATPGVGLPVDKRITLATAFKEVWNQVQGTRAAAYAGGDSVVVVLDTNDPEKFIARLRELVDVWDKVSIELAGGDELKAIYRFDLSEDVSKGRKAFQLSLTERAAGAMNEWKLKIVPIGRQMVLFFGKDEVVQFSEAIKNVAAEVPLSGLAEHPDIVEAEGRFPATRKMEIHLWLSEIMRSTADKGSFWGVKAAKYSSASLTLGENSLGMDVWIPAEEIAWILERAGAGAER